MSLLFSNHAETQLAAPFLATDLTMVLPTGEAALFNVLNTGQSELVTLTDGVNYEVVEITAWAGDIATVTRGIEGTAQAWATGVIVSSRVTAGILNAMLQRVELNDFIAAQVAVAVAAIGGSSPLKTNIVVIKSGVIAYDASSYDAALASLPDYFLIEYALTVDFVFTLPSLANLPAGSVVDFNIVTESVASLRVTANPAAGDYMNNTINGSDYTFSNFHTFRGFKKSDGTGHWVY